MAGYQSRDRQNEATFKTTELWFPMKVRLHAFLLTWNPCNSLPVLNQSTSVCVFWIIVATAQSPVIKRINYTSSFHIRISPEIVGQWPWLLKKRGKRAEKFFNKIFNLLDVHSVTISKELLGYVCILGISS